MSSFDGFMIDEAVKKSRRIEELERQLSEATARIRALDSDCKIKDASIEQLQNMVRGLQSDLAAARAVIERVQELADDWHGTAQNFDDDEVGEQYEDMACALDAALSPTVSEGAGEGEGHG